jgi:hypothetical protein
VLHTFRRTHCRVKTNLVIGYVSIVVLEKNEKIKFSADLLKPFLWWRRKWIALGAFGA